MRNVDNNHLTTGMETAENTLGGNAIREQTITMPTSIEAQKRRYVDQAEVYVFVFHNR